MEEGVVSAGRARDLRAKQGRKGKAWFGLQGRLKHILSGQLSPGLLQLCGHRHLVEPEHGNMHRP